MLTEENYHGKNMLVIVFESRVMVNQLTSISTFYDEPFPFSIEILSVSSSNSSPSSVTLYQFTLSGFLGSFSFTWILSNHQDMNFLFMQSWNYSSLWPVSTKHSLILFLLKYSIEAFILYKTAFYNVILSYLGPCYKLLLLYSKLL